MSSAVTTTRCIATPASCASTGARPNSFNNLGRVDERLRPRGEGTVGVGEGRALGYAEWGDRDGRPVVTFHGGWGSRLMGVPCEPVATDLGVRLVCLERPGFGYSEFVAGRTLL